MKAADFSQIWTDDESAPSAGCSWIANLYPGRRAGICCWESRPFEQTHQPRQAWLLTLEGKPRYAGRLKEKSHPPVLATILRTEQGGRLVDLKVSHEPVVETAGRRD